MNDFCLSCTMKSTCEKICPKLEKHLKKDIEVYPKRFENPSGLIFDSAPKLPNIRRKIKLTETQARIVALLLQGLEPIDVIKQMKISRGRFDGYTSEIRKVIREMDGEDFEEEKREE